MRNMKYSKLAAMAAVIGILTLATAQPFLLKSPEVKGSLLPVAADDSKSQGSVGNDGFYLARRDVRRCVFPLCGGYWVKLANRSTTRCANGRWMRECYVAEMDWNAQPELEPARGIFRGRIVARSFPGFGNLGALRVDESWQSASDNQARGLLYRVRDRGVRCITHPCLSHEAAKLNSLLVQKIAGVDLAAAGAAGEATSEAAAAMTETGGVLVAGHYVIVRGPGGRARALKANKFYLRASTIGPTPPAAKRCFKTGCSAQVCADHEVITTCEFRAEYACYQRAACERQANGECGFTQTRELAACIARARR